MTTLPINRAYRDAFRITIGTQILVSLFLVTILDGGQLAKYGACAIVGYWIGAAIIVFRRPSTPQPVDLLYVRWAYLLFVVVGLGLLFF